MQTTSNLQLMKPDQSDLMSVVLSAINSNSDKLDGLPLPVSEGSNGELSYIRLANGLTVMFGTIRHDNRYPCTDFYGEGYYSELVTVSFPDAIVNMEPVVVATPCCSPNMDVNFYVYEVQQTYLTGKYVCPGPWDAANNNMKKLSIIIIGRWKS